jgi:hypothetical protein
MSTSLLKLLWSKAPRLAPTDCTLGGVIKSMISPMGPAIKNQHVTIIISGVTTYLQTHHPEGPYKMKIKTQNSYLWIFLAFFGK